MEKPFQAILLAITLHNWAPSRWDPLKHHVGRVEGASGLFLPKKESWNIYPRISGQPNLWISQGWITLLCFYDMLAYAKQTSKKALRQKSWRESAAETLSMHTGKVTWEVRSGLGNVQPAKSLNYFCNLSIGPPIDLCWREGGFVWRQSRWLWGPLDSAGVETWIVTLLLLLSDQLT